MLTINSLMEILNRFIKIARRRYGDIIVDEIRVHKSKYIVYVKIMNTRVKIVFNKRRMNVRVYCGLTGLEKSIRRILSREYSKLMEERDLGEESI